LPIHLIYAASRMGKTNWDLALGLWDLVIYLDVKLLAGGFQDCKLNAKYSSALN
jgi:hypothetical protein